MSNLPTVIQETDIMESEMVKVNQFIEDGLPGLVNITDSQMYRMYDLYLTGSTYSEISSTLNIKKVIILYLSHNSGWYTSKKEYLSEVQEKIKNRVVESKLRSHVFMLQLVQSWQKKIGHKMTAFLATNDPAHMDEIDLKEVAQLMKAIEMVNDLDSTGKGSNGKASPIGINVGNNGVTIEKSGDNKISITPNETKIGDILKQHADSHREEERKKLFDVEKKRDIDNNTENKNEK